MPRKAKGLTKAQQYYLHAHLASIEDERLAADIGTDIATVARFRADHPPERGFGMMEEKGAVAMTASASAAVDERRGRRSDATNPKNS